MHEWGLACELVELLKKEADKNNAKLVDNIHLKIGSASGISIEAFEFALEAAVKNTIIKLDGLKIESVTAISKCLDCGNEFSDPDGSNICDKCSSIRKTLLNPVNIEVESFTIS